MQGDKTSQCLEVVRALQKFSGDVSCEGAMRDLDIIQHFNVPCRFE
jgi:hypothetical protein